MKACIVVLFAYFDLLSVRVSLFSAVFNQHTILLLHISGGVNEEFGTQKSGFSVGLEFMHLSLTDLLKLLISCMWS